MNDNTHNWNVSPREAMAIQQGLRAQVRLEPLARAPRLIAGADVSLNLYATTIYAGFVVLSYPDARLIEQAAVRDETTFPYIPGLLSFREIPSLLKAWEKLSIKPDLIVVDGAGVAHPRRLGIASHLGVLLDIPTIGCAKSRLIGVYQEPGIEVGAVSYLYDERTGETIGAVVRTKRGVKPLFISPGHRVTLAESVAIIQALIRKHRLPEITRLAHETVNIARRAGS